MRKLNKLSLTEAIVRSQTKNCETAGGVNVVKLKANILFYLFYLWNLEHVTYSFITQSSTIMTIASNIIRLIL